MAKPTLATALKAVQRDGALLVFPMEGRAALPSLWSRLHPGAAMRWDWDDSGDQRVFDLWHLRAKLMTSRRAVYAKWFRGRATVFAPDVFTAMLCAVRDARDPRKGLLPEAAAIMEALDESSPVSSKELRRLTDLQGKFYERQWAKATAQLWSRLLIVGYGEVEDGAFPSLAIGATQSLFDDLWDESGGTLPSEAHATLTARLGAGSAFHRYFEKTLKEMRADLSR